MNKKEVKNYIKNMDKNGLTKLCEDVYKWKYVTGTLDPCCSLNQLAENLQYWKIRDIEDMVLEVAGERFRDIVLLLFKTNPTDYLR